VAVLMCFWALSGIVMWFQMKNVRYWGLVALLCTFVITRYLGGGMYNELPR
jgi:hypothetical protein